MPVGSAALECISYSFRFFTSPHFGIVEVKLAAMLSRWDLMWLGFAALR